MERLFGLSGLLVMPFWFLMIACPRWTRTERVLRSVAVVLGPALLYALLVLPALGAILPVVARGRLAEVAPLLGTPAGATVAWAHFLAFDLFVGRSIYLDARQRGVSAWITSPVLALTLMLGPLGLLAYLGIVAWRSGLAAPAAAVWRAALDGSRPLAALAAGSVGLLGAALLLQLVDPRQVLGVSTWVKPAKFAASIASTRCRSPSFIERWACERGVRRSRRATGGEGAGGDRLVRARPDHGPGGARRPEPLQPPEHARLRDLRGHGPRDHDLLARARLRHEAGLPVIARRRRPSPGACAWAWSRRSVAVRSASS